MPQWGEQVVARETRSAKQSNVENWSGGASAVYEASVPLHTCLFMQVPPTGHRKGGENVENAENLIPLKGGGRWSPWSTMVAQLKLNEWAERITDYEKAG